MSSQPADLSRPVAQTLLQAIVVLWGFTAILGRQISIHAIPLVWWRLVISVAVLAVLVPVRGHRFAIPRRAAVHYAIVGALIAAHWLCFYGAIKEAGIATAVITLSMISFFTALLEPIVFRRRVDVGELVIGAGVVFGVVLLVQVELEVTPAGLALGFGSAVFSAIFSVLNGKFARREVPERLMFYELAAALVVVSACFAVAPGEFVGPGALAGADVVWIAVLAIGCTVVPQVLIIRVLRTLSPFTVAVATNLEPVYALLIAAVAFPADEHLTLGFYLGAAVLFGLVVLNSVRRTKR